MTEYVFVETTAEAFWESGRWLGVGWQPDDAPGQVKKEERP